MRAGWARLSVDRVSEPARRLGHEAPTGYERAQWTTFGATGDPLLALFPVSLVGVRSAILLSVWSSPGFVDI